MYYIMRQSHEILIDDEDILSPQTWDIDHHIGTQHNVRKIELIGSCSSCAADSTISFQRSVDGTNFYTSETILVNSASPIYLKTDMTTRFCRLLINNAMTGLTIYLSSFV